MAAVGENDYILAKNPTEFNSADKIKCLSYMRISVSLGIFFTLVQATNILLINAKASNPITLWWGIITLLMTALNIINLIVSIRQSRALSNSNDDYGLSSDNLLNRSLFVFNLFITFGFILYFIVYKFAQNELWDHFQMLNQVKFLDGFKAYLADKSAWLNFLSLVNIAIGCHAVITYYGLTASQPAVRFYIFSTASFLCLVSFFILSQFNVLRSVFHGHEHIFSFNAWNDRLTWAFAIAAIPITVLIYLANFKRLKNGVLILGTLLLILVAIQASAAGQTYRDYKAVDGYFRPRCGPELSKIHRSYIETFPCQNKYVYENKHQCPQSTNTITDCLKDPHICDRSLLVRAWESNITLDSSAPIYGCADEKACGALNLIYTSPVLVYATLVLLWCLLAFALSSFSFLLSSKPQGDQLNSGIITLFWAILALVLVIGFFLLGLYTVPTIPKRPLVTDAFSVKEQALTAEDDAVAFLSTKSISHGHKAAAATAAAKIDHNEVTRDQDSGNIYEKKDCKKFFNAVYGVNGASASRLNRYDGSAAVLTNQRDDISSWIPDDERIDPANNSITNKGYLVCISTYNKPADKNKPMFIVPENFEINRNHDVFQLEGYSCAKNVLESKNPTDDAVKYNDDRAYIGFIGTKDAVDLVFKHDLEVCEDNTISSTDLPNHKFLIIVSEVDLEGHYGDRLLSKDFRHNHVIPPTLYPAADLTADQLKKITSSFSLRLFNLTVTDAENGRALLPNTEFAIQGATLNPGNDAKAKDTCEINFDWAPIKKANKPQAHTFGYTNDIAQSHIVIVLKGEKKPDPTAVPDVTKNNSPYVGLSTLTLKYRLYAWRWVDNKVEHNCREFQVSHNNKVTQEEIQLSRILNPDQIRVVLQWRDPTVNLDLLSTFRKKAEWICNVAAFEDRCGRAQHFGETQSGLAASTTEVIVLTNPGHSHYAFSVSNLLRHDNMTADPKTFQLKFRDSLPVVTYYKYKDGNKYDQVVAVARPFSDFATFTNCNDDACKFKLPPATYEGKDSNTIDLANMVFCVRGDDKHLPLKVDVLTGATKTSNNGFTWNFANTETLEAPANSGLDPKDFKRSLSKHFMFPVSDICQI